MFDGDYDEDDNENENDSDLPTLDETSDMSDDFSKSDSQSILDENDDDGHMRIKRKSKLYFFLSISPIYSSRQN